MEIVSSAREMRRFLTMAVGRRPGMCRKRLPAGTTRSAAKLAPRNTLDSQRSTLRNTASRFSRSLSRPTTKLVPRRTRGFRPPIFMAHRTSERTSIGRRPGPLPQKYTRTILSTNAFGEVGPRLDPDVEQIKSIEGDSKLDERGFASLECESPFIENAAIGHCIVSWRTEVTSV